MNLNMVTVVHGVYCIFLLDSRVDEFHHSIAVILSVEYLSITS
jgi:hypothetical protein